MTEERKNEIISLLGHLATLDIANDEMEQRGIKHSEVMEYLSELSYPDDTFKRKMAELAKKYHISHKRDIDWHNFVAEVEQLTHPELAESEEERIIKFLKHAATLDVADELFQEYGVKHTQVIAWLEKQKEQKPEHFELKAGKWYICHRAFCCRADHLTVKEGERFMCEKDGVVKGFVIKEPEKYFKECSAPAPMEDEQKEQKPAEWNEEDEKMHRKLMDHLDWYGCKGLNHEECDQLRAWLTNLSEQLKKL